MNSYGKNSSLIKRSMSGSAVNNVISRTVIFAHEATSVASSINLSSLNAPPSMVANGFSNPNVSQLPFLKLFKSNISVESTYKGALQDLLDYELNANNVISFLNSITTEPGEIFVIRLVLPNNLDTESILNQLSNPQQLIDLARYNVAIPPLDHSNISEADISAILQYVTAKNRASNVGVGGESTFTVSGFPGSSAFDGGVLMSDGRVFCVPFNNTTARIYDPLTNSIITPSGSYPGTQAFQGGVLLKDGRVFLIPANTTSPRIYNPFTDAVTTPSGSYPGSFGLTGGVLLRDGRVFCVPGSSTTARIYDPVTDTTSTPGGTYPGSGAFWGGVLLLDGRVFCVPRSSTTAHIYDPATNTVLTTASGFPGSEAFRGGVLLPDGRVFCVPFNSTTARIYNPVTNTITTPSGSYPGSAAFSNGALLTDGRVFCIPFGSTTARIYDPVTDTTSTPAATFPGGNAFRSGTLLPDGRLFLVPIDSTSARIVSGNFSRQANEFQFPFKVLLSSHLNKL